MSWASEFASELLTATGGRPLGLVVLTGLDITYNALHKAIWDSFCNNRRSDRLPLKFKMLPSDHDYPKCSSKRTSYEWYIPKGILKTNWMKKHLKEIPAVVVMFFDLDWDEPMWKERLMACATKVEIVRNSLLGRSTRVAVVLIQRNTPLPPGEDVMAVDRAASLCSACELSAKSLYVLPLTDHLLGYTIRLENAFYELAQSYYHTEARKVKAHRDFLNKTTHHLLYVRHQFKIAFYNELKQDSQTTLKHYKQAYSHLIELRINDTNLLEVKTVAGFINYKICRFCFQHNTPLDSIAQFRKHNEFFKNRVGPDQLAFEHHAWMAKQYQVFGDLFDEAIKLGLTAIHTQHPGFYYQQAASHAVKRKQLFRKLVAAQPTQPETSGAMVISLEDMSGLEYYGQRPWRQGHQSNEPPDIVQEREGILALQRLEGAVEHSSIVIPLLSSAVAQFRKYKSPRMKRHLMVQMAEEYEQSHEYTKVLALLSRVLWEYRQDGWKTLFTSVLLTSVRCAYMLADIQQYVSNCTELISMYSTCSRQEKTRIQMNLIRAMSSESPEMEPGCDVTYAEKAKLLWKATTNENFSLKMNSINSFVDCRACFTQTSFTSDTDVCITVHIRTTCEFPVKFSKLSVHLSNQSYNEACTLTCEARRDEASLYVVPQQTKDVSFSFRPLAADVAKTLEIVCVSLELGERQERCAILQWNVTQPAASTAQTRIRPRESNLDVSLDYTLPCLVDEFFVVTIRALNSELKQIDNVRLSVTCGEQGKACSDAIGVSFKVDVKSPELRTRAESALGSISPGLEVTTHLYLKSDIKTAELKLLFTLTYEIEGDDGVNYHCECHKQLVLEVVDCFGIESQLNNLQFEPTEYLEADDSFILSCTIKSLSQLTTVIQSSHVELSPSVMFADQDVTSQLQQVTLKSSDVVAEHFCLKLSPTMMLQQDDTNLGSYVLKWRRLGGGDDVPCSETRVTLPRATVQRACVSAHAQTHAHARMRCSLPLTFNIYNQSAFAQQLQAELLPSDAFMFAGQKKLSLRILPHRCHQLHYNLVPLLPGNVLLPVLQLNLLRSAVGMQVSTRQLPTHIYVMPSGKDNKLSD